MVNIVASATVGILLGLSGLALRYYYMAHAGDLPEGLTPQSGADRLMPTFFADALPAGFGGLMLVSFLCDALQTLGSGVNSIAAIYTTSGAAASAAAPKPSVRRARLTSLVAGAVATALAFLATSYALSSGKTIFDMLPRMYNMFLSPLAVMFMVGMFYRRATAGVVLIVVIFTQIFSSVWSWWSEVPGLLRLLGLDTAATWWTSLQGATADGQLRTPTVMLAIATPALFGIVVGGVLSFLLGRSDHRGIHLTLSPSKQRLSANGGTPEAMLSR